jgi:hypothetical protein
MRALWTHGVLCVVSLVCCHAGVAVARQCVHALVFAYAAALSTRSDASPWLQNTIRMNVKVRTAMLAQCMCVCLAQGTLRCLWVVPACSTPCGTTR